MSDIKMPRSANDEDRDEHRDLDDLGDKLRKVQKSRAAKKGYDRPDDDMPNNGLGLGLRIGMELLVGVMVGLGIGWFIDRTFGTEPWGLLIFFMLGFAAGMLNVVRAASKANDFDSDQDGSSGNSQD